MLPHHIHDTYLQKASSVKEALEILGKTIGNKQHGLIDIDNFQLFQVVAINWKA